MADNTNEYIEYHGIFSGLRLVYATESLLDDRLLLSEARSNPAVRSKHMNRSYHGTARAP
jgi:hypothetical protein